MRTLSFLIRTKYPVSISRKQIRGLVKVLAINVVMLAVLLELASSGFYFVQTRKFFYTRTEKVPAWVKALAGSSQNEAGPSQGPIFQLHPYFGYVSKHDRALKFSFSTVATNPNNYGFYSTYSYPFKKQREKQFVIGVFGGSVAMSLSLFELDYHILTQSLQQLPSFKDKEIIVLSFANGSYKQPQQLLLLSYFLSIGQDFDMVINVDGFNEVALSYLNNQHGIDIAMPNQLVIMPLVQLANRDLSPEQLSLTLDILQSKSRVKSALARLENCRLATCYALNWLQLKYVSRQHDKELMRFSQLQESIRPNDNSLVKIDGPATPLDDSLALQQIGSLWAESSVMMKNTLDSRHASYFHFLQTNQYQDTGRKFNAEDHKIAFDPPSPYAVAARKGYPVLLARADSLKSSGIHFFNGINVFDNLSETVYSDNCCHYNEVGYAAFWRFISKSITETIVKDSKLQSSRQ